MRAVRLKSSPWWAALIGATLSLGAAFVFLIGDRTAGLPAAPYLLFERLTRLLPGRLVSLGIDGMVSLITALGVRPVSTAAKIAEKGLAIALFMGLGACAGVVLALAGRRGRRSELLGLAAGVGLFALSALAGGRAAVGAGVALSLVWLGAVCLAWGALLGRATAPVFSEAPEAGARRVWLMAVLGAGATALLAVVLGQRRRRGQGAGGGDREAALALLGQTAGPAASPPARALEERALPPRSTRPEITANQDFYRVDINLRPPEVDADAWRLVVGGLVARPLALTLGELRARPSITQAITLECISNPVGGDLIGTSLWTGVRLRDVLGEAGLRPEARAVVMHAADGFHETIERDDFLDERTLLVHAMNGAPLPAAHGFPLRIYIPDRYGMKQPKWIERLEAVSAWRPGYWVERGWSREARPQTTSVIDGVELAAGAGQGDTVLVGGIAFAGARGVSRVEVQVDDGPWQPAELRAPPLGPLTWVQWRFAWPRSPGRHSFRARAYDGRGHLQPIEVSPPHPAGATGVHSVSKTV
jgi:DMSO/TMAO reductase YedYZ molybdopterin-dependent catalytic subunit